MAYKIDLTDVDLELSIQIPLRRPQTGLDEVNHFWSKFGSTHTFDLTLDFEPPKNLNDFLHKQTMLAPLFQKLFDYQLHIHEIMFSEYAFSSIMKDDSISYRSWKGCFKKVTFVSAWNFDESDKMTLQDEADPVANFDPYISLQVEPGAVPLGCGVFSSSGKTLFLPLAGIISLSLLKDTEQFTPRAQ